jgi:hypothetical protein
MSRQKATQHIVVEGCFADWGTALAWLLRGIGCYGQTGESGGMLHQTNWNIFLRTTNGEASLPEIISFFCRAVVHGPHRHCSNNWNNGTLLIKAVGLVIEQLHRFTPQSPQPHPDSDLADDKKIFQE